MTIDDYPAPADVNDLESEQHGSEGDDAPPQPDGENTVGDEGFTLVSPVADEGSHEAAVTMISVFTLEPQSGNVISEETAASPENSASTCRSTIQVSMHEV